MKIKTFVLLTLCSIRVLAQETEKIEIPKGVVYHYCDPLLYENAKTLVRQELSTSPSYSLNKGLTFIGPAIWSRYRNVANLKKIKGGDITILGYDNKKPSGK